MLSCFSHLCFVLQPVSQLEYHTKICVTNEIHKITHLFNVTHVYFDVLKLYIVDTKLWLDQQRLSLDRGEKLSGNEAKPSNR